MVRLGAGVLAALLVAACGGSSTSTKDSPGDTSSGSPKSSTGADTGVGGY